MTLPTLEELDRAALRAGVAEQLRGAARAWPIGHPHNVECHRLADLLDPPITVADVVGATTT